MKQLDPEITQIIQMYVEATNKKMPGVIQGLYIYGSISYGDYYSSVSDIDFVTLVSHSLNQDEIRALEKIHRDIEELYSKPNMNGIYVQANDLGQLETNIQPFPYYHNGMMHDAGHFEINLVTWYVLKNHGITIMGPEIKEFDFNVDWDLLISRMRENLNTYWLDWIRKHALTDHSAKIDFGKSELEWGVLGITRLFYTFRENDITTKVKAGEYALSIVSEEWHEIVKLAIAIRKESTELSEESIEHQKMRSLEYMEYILRECNRLFENQGVEN